MPEWALRLYAAVPEEVRVLGGDLWRLFRSLTVRVPVTKLRAPVGQQGEPASVIVAGAQPWVEYLPGLFFQGSPQREPLGEVPVWVLPRTLERLASSVSLVIARVDRLSARLLFGDGYLWVPEMVGLWLKVAEDVEWLSASNRRETVRSDIRRLRKNRLLCEISHSEADLAEFYHHFYTPFVQRRFGKYAWPPALRDLRRGFQRGGLIWVVQDGQRIAGSVFERQGTVLRLLRLGTIGGDYSVAKLGALMAIYYFLIEHAHHTGCEEMDFGGSRALLTDGRLRYKRKWGMKLLQEKRSYQFLIRWEHLDQSVLTVLAQTAPLFREQGYLSAVSALNCEGPATQDEITRAYRFLWTPGLRNLYLLSASGFRLDINAPPHTRLIDLRALQAADLPRLLTSGELADMATGAPLVRGAKAQQPAS